MKNRVVIGTRTSKLALYQTNKVKQELKKNFPNIFFEIIDYAIEDYKQMFLMSCCEHNIIANSTFSWWGAWLSTNENKRVIAPSKWFGPPLDQINDTKDLYCEGWEVV